MLFDDFEDVMATDTMTRRRLCGFGKWASGLAGEDRKLAEDLVRDKAYTCRQLARYFATKGGTFNDQVINRHRNGQCCGQKTCPGPTSSAHEMD